MDRKKQADIAATEMQLASSVCVCVGWVVGNLMQTIRECLGIKPIYILYVYMVWLEEALGSASHAACGASYMCI